MNGRDAIVTEIPRLRRYARALTGQDDRADDLVQDTLERALDKWRFWKSTRDLRPWLFAIMHNLHIDHHRRETRIEYCDDEDLPELVQRPEQSDTLELNELDHALSLLPLEQREVLLLVALEELSYADVAKAIGQPKGTVMSRLSRARARLKAILAGEREPHLKVVSS